MLQHFMVIDAARRTARGAGVIAPHRSMWWTGTAPHIAVVRTLTHEYGAAPMQGRSFTRLTALQRVQLWSCCPTPGR